MVVEQFDGQRVSHQELWSPEITDSFQGLKDNHQLRNK
jgi:hypothetical protein